MPGKLPDRRSRRSRLFWGLALGFLIIVLVRLFMPDLVWLGARKVTVTDIKPDSGLRLIGTLSDPLLGDEKAPTGARLDLVERKPGGFLHALDERFEGSWAFAWLTSLYDVNYPGATHETVLPLGPGAAPPADIAVAGAGRFSIHDGHVLFSLPGETKLADIHRLELWVPRIKAFAGHESWPRALRWFTGALIAVLVIGLLWITPASLADNWWPGLTITLILLPVLFAGRELYMRSTGQFPKSMMTWPATFSPEAGVVFAPRAVVRFTDGSEFWTADTTNSIGFLDHEPVIPKPSGTFRILLVGDSIVEALQVPLAQKMQTRLAASLRKAFPGQKTDVVAVARSGIGQGSELGFYNVNRQLRPDLVILMFVGNDFANNSILLESMRSGFSPDHRPWWFPAIDDDKRCTLLPPGRDWEKHLLTSPSERIARLRSRSAADARLVDTVAPEFVDSVFYRNGQLPEIYQQAVELTKCSFSLWKETAERDGFKLLIVATDDVTIPVKSGQIDRIKAISRELQIPLFDLYPAWAGHGITGGKFTFDGHWNAEGHHWSADAIFDYLASHELVGAPASRR